MSIVRAFLFRHRRLAVWLVAAALAMKMLVPAGFMPGLSGGTMVIQLCTGQGAQTLVMEIPGKAGNHDQGDPSMDAPCAFSGLSAPTLAGADPMLLAIAIAFIIATTFRVAPALIPARGLYLRPPSQGPPATA